MARTFRINHPYFPTGITTLQDGEELANLINFFANDGVRDDEWDEQMEESFFAVARLKPQQDEIMRVGADWLRIE